MVHNVQYWYATSMTNLQTLEYMLATALLFGDGLTLCYGLATALLLCDDWTLCVTGWP